MFPDAIPPAERRPRGDGPSAVVVVVPPTPVLLLPRPGRIVGGAVRLRLGARERPRNHRRGALPRPPRRRPRRPPRVLLGEVRPRGPHQIPLENSQTARTRAAPRRGRRGSADPPPGPAGRRGRRVPCAVDGRARPLLGPAPPHGREIRPRSAARSAAVGRAGPRSGPPGAPARLDPIRSERSVGGFRRGPSAGGRPGTGPDPPPPTGPEGGPSERPPRGGQDIARARRRGPLWLPARGDQCLGGPVGEGVCGEASGAHGGLALLLGMRRSAQLHHPGRGGWREPAGGGFHRLRPLRGTAQKGREAAKTLRAAARHSCVQQQVRARAQAVAAAVLPHRCAAAGRPEGRRPPPRGVEGGGGGLRRPIPHAACGAQRK
mmetsp:Transcript_31250/g.61877  ORF Transcript_31250/g.61877 Transcript_31250/m.61877 type:complete len:376 (-) Transcript_31250:151-1278(-)